MKSMTGSDSASPTPYTSRWEERDARRKANAQVAREAAQRRAGKKASLVERVAKAQKKLGAVNTAGAIQLIQEVSPADYDVYIIAEETGQARRGVLKQFGAPRNSVKLQYLEEVGGAGLGSPNQSPDGAEEE